MIRELNKAVPKIPVPATQQECAAGVKQIRSSYKVLLPEWEYEFDSMFAKLKRQLSLLENANKRCKEESKARNKRPAKRDLNKLKNCVRHADKLQRAKTVLEHTRQGPGPEVLLQTALQSLVQGQDPELRQWFYNEFLSEFGQHLNKSECWRPTVTIATKRPTPDVFHLPPEIASMIFSIANLEACVTLREVSSFWYKIFDQQPESFWKLKLAKRNPWMCPGDQDLCTYADCALVFTRRLKSWPSENSLDDIPETQNEMTFKEVVAFELGSEQKVPDDFESVMQSTDLPHDNWLHKSLEFTTHHVTDEEGTEKTIVTCDGAEITLNISSTDEWHIEEVQRGPTYYYVTFPGNNFSLALPFGSLDEKDGIWLDDTHEESKHIGGGVFITCWGLEAEVFDEIVYHTFGSKERIDVGATHSYCEPVAFLNGAVWWHLGKRGLVPTFIDMQNPKEHYYQPKRAIQMDGVGPPQCSRSRGLNHLITDRSVTDTLRIYDLSKKIVTVLHPPLGWKNNQKMCPGHVRGVFQALSEQIEDRNSADDPKHDQDVWYRFSKCRSSGWDNFDDMQISRGGVVSTRVIEL